MFSTIVAIILLFFKFLPCRALILRGSHLLLLSQDYVRVLSLNKELMLLVLVKVAHEFELPDVFSELTVPQL